MILDLDLLFPYILSIYNLFLSPSKILGFVWFEGKKMEGEKITETDG
jgi:hypothetical protein